MSTMANTRQIGLALAPRGGGLGRLVGAVAAAALVAAATHAAAQSPAGAAPGADSRADASASGSGAQKVPIPLPGERSAIFAGEVHLDGVFPILRKPLCPSGAACIFGLGAGVGGLFERRWLSGFSLGVGYDLWLLDSNGVYEVTAIQDLSANIRYRLLPRRRAHPFIGAAVGGLLLGGNLNVAAWGGSAEAVIGVELEMSDSLALVIATDWRLFMTSSFRTQNDGVERVRDQGVDFAAGLRLGVAILQ